MKLSIVIICWNDMKVLPACLESIVRETRKIDYEIIISDNGSVDGVIEFVRSTYPQARIVENKTNLGYARGNNAGISVATGDYILILNPDTIIHDGALDTWIAWADNHPEAGAFGCKIINPDGSFQNPARPFPTVLRYWIAAFGLHPLARYSRVFLSNIYAGWQGESERTIDWQSGCCILFRGDLLKALGGFDGRFFYHYEEVDLCFRVAKTGTLVRYTPDAVVTHLGGQSVGRFPVRFEIEKYRNRYRYFHKHYGMKGACRCKAVSVMHILVRQSCYGLLAIVSRREALRNRLEMYRVVRLWHRKLNMEHFILKGEEPDVGCSPLAPAPKISLNN